MIPSDEEIRQLHEWAIGTERRVENKDIYLQEHLQDINQLLLWGLAQRARAMRAEWPQVHFAGGCMRQFCPDKEKHDWTDDQWLHAAAESVGIKLEEK